MPDLIPTTIAAGTLSRTAQPSIRAGDGLVLRPWTLADAAAVVAAFDDPDIQYWHARRLDSVEEAQRLISGWQSAWSDESGCHWAVTGSEADEFLGRIALKPLDLQEGTAGLAYWIVPGARGRGVCTDSAKAVAEWAFHTVGFHRIELEHSTGNHASCRVAVKAGFLAEGTRRSAAKHADGWHDMHVHARLRSDDEYSRLRCKQDVSR